MNIMFANLLDAAPAQGSGGGMSLIFMLVLMFVIMYFFMIRPQQKRQKEIQKFREALAVGSQVVTAGGVYGIVKELKAGEPYIMLEIAKGVTIKVDRNNVFAEPSQATK